VYNTSQRLSRDVGENKTMKNTIRSVFIVIGMTILACAQDKPLEEQASPLQLTQIQDQFKMIGPDSILFIRDPKAEGWGVQISGGGGPPTPNTAGFQVYYPTNERPAKVFASVGMTIPASWQVLEFKYDKASPSNSYCLFEIPKNDVTNHLPRFTHDYFFKFMKRPLTDKLTFEKIQ